MIEINLLPEEYKIKDLDSDSNKELNSFQLGLQITGGLVVLALSFYVVFVFFPLNGKKLTLSKYQKELLKIKKEEARAIALSDSLEEQKKQFEKINSLQEAICWAQKMNVISNALHSSIQLTLIDLKQRSETIIETRRVKKKVGKEYKLVSENVKVEVLFYTLDIEGKVLFQGGENNVGRFIENLNADAGFFNDFDYIKLIKISVVNEDLKQFSIRCRFKENLNSLLDVS